MSQKEIKMSFHYTLTSSALCVYGESEHVEIPKDHPNFREAVNLITTGCTDFQDCAISCLDWPTAENGRHFSGVNRALYVCNVMRCRRSAATTLGYG